MKDAAVIPDRFGMELQSPLETPDKDCSPHYSHYAICIYLHAMILFTADVKRTLWGRRLAFRITSVKKLRSLCREQDQGSTRYLHLLFAFT